MTESFSAKAAKGAMELTPLIPDHVRAEVTIRPRPIAVVTDTLG
jgi:hypothetical protein